MSPVQGIVERNLAALAAYVQEMRSLAALDLASYRRDAGPRRAAERLLQLCMQAAADACAGLLAAAGRAPAPDLRAGFAAAALGALPADLAESLGRSAGLRDRIVHDYEDLDGAAVGSAARTALRVFPASIASATAHPAAQGQA